MIEGADPVRAGHELRRAAVEAQHESRQSRALLDPSEVLGLPGGKTLVLAGGYELPPFIADKVPYFLRREFAGRVFPNPYVQRDMSAISVPGFFGMRTKRIIEAPVPSWAAHLPQYDDGRPLRYVEGFFPRAR
jgi:type IV secretion system protein VirD4